MKISEMITHLEKLKENHGDQDCFYYGQGAYNLFYEDCIKYHKCLSFVADKEYEGKEGVLFG